MNGEVVAENIIRVFLSGKAEAVLDEMLEERSVEFFADGRLVSSAVITSGNEELWAIGNLFCRGVISCAGDVISISVAPDTITAVLSEKHVSAAKAPKPMPVDWKMTAASIISGVEWLAEDPLFQRTGCVHATALISRSGEKLFRAADVSRRNAVEKAIGWLLKSGTESGGVALFTSGRLPEDLVTKGLMAGIPLMASISAATVQGVEAARRGNMTLICFIPANIQTLKRKLCCK